MWFILSNQSSVFVSAVVPAVGRFTGHALCWRSSSWRSFDSTKPQTVGGEAADCRFVLWMIKLVNNQSQLYWIYIKLFVVVLSIYIYIYPCRGRSCFSASEGGAVNGADVHPAIMASGGNGESTWRTAGQCSAHPGCDGGDAAPQAEVTVFFFLFSQQEATWGFFNSFWKAGNMILRSKIKSASTTELWSDLAPWDSHVFC